jgi:hypothetical protein
MFRKAWLLMLTLCAGMALAETPAPRTETIRGWPCDEHCASSKARHGLYAATNPDCSKKCAAKGYKIVLIDPKQKCVLLVTDQDLARKNLEITSR